jgi:hypothetical protein
MANMPSIRGDIDTTYHTQQRDMFASGLAAEIGVHAFAVWHAIKSHADFQTGVAWPGIRRLCELTGTADKTVQAAIKTLVGAHLLRVTKRGQKNVYVARERMDVRIGDRVICTVVVDFVPATMRDKLAKLKGAASGQIESADVWAEVELIPGPGLKLDATSGTFKATMRADEIPEQLSQAEAASMLSSATEARKKLKELALEMKSKSGGRAPKKEAP